MSTIGYENWAVDLANVGAVYPFQGWEMAMTVVCVVFWLGWHRWQFKREDDQLKMIAAHHDKAETTAILDHY